MLGTCIGYEMCQCKTMSGTWHRHREMRANVRPCLGHGVGLDLDSQCKTMFGTWHRLNG
ncbi:Activin receptor type-2A [Gossypium arboreum]|uniref:Activin receptor type-2A n=1 Tax=Gossypium arboreum TaxID=29729 RepID=A0A0B0MYN2_GOSAR|nr:Activin receptor type-2A [Gossypium arboreum]KHG04173.1 Activin receptor type-2A [Gossypium arboreum]